MTFRGRNNRKPQTYLVHGVTRAGRVGVGVFRDGTLVAWGVNVSAALATLQVNAA